MPSFKMKFSGVTILQGVEFSIFPIDFEWALQQCSATALPVNHEDDDIYKLEGLSRAHTSPPTLTFDLQNLITLFPVCNAALGTLFCTDTKLTSVFISDNTIGTP